MARRARPADLVQRVRSLAEGLRPRLSFSDWCRETSPRLSWDWRHLVLIREVLERVDPRAPADGTLIPLPSFPAIQMPRVIKRLRLSVPPRHGKSEQVTIRWPGWLLEADPTLRVIVGSYNQQLAEKFSRRTRRLISGRVVLAGDRNTAADWETTAEGGLRAVGVGSGITGHGGDVVLIDDPVKSREEAESPTYRNRVHDWYTDDLYTRLEPEGVIVLIMTRWHHDDLAGRIARSDEGGDWVTINLPALAEAEGDLLGRAEGEALCPERLGVAHLERIRRAVGRNFISLYQGRPTPAEGALLRRTWFRRYAQSPLNPIRIVQSWDCAQSDDPTADYSCCGTWAQTHLGHYLLDVSRERMTYPQIKRRARVLQQQWGAQTLLIEDKSHGAALIQDLRADATWRTPIIDIMPTLNKTVRLAVESDQVEAGLVWLPESAPWLTEYEDELIRFPSVENDDQADQTSQYLRWSRGADGRTAGYTWMEIPGL